MAMDFSKKMTKKIHVYNSSMRFFASLALLVLLPSFAFGAGFAKESLFLSKTPVTEGETVFIHAVVANESSAKFSGEVVFRDKEEKIGTIAVTIAPGGAQAVSLSWKSTSGSHEIVAELTASDGTVVEELKATFSIAAKPIPSATNTSNSVGSSQNIQENIANVSPEVAGAIAPVFEVLDSFREKGAVALDKGI